MTAKIIDGRAVAKEVRDAVAADVAAMVAEGKNPPGLATVLVGENPASQVYVSMKHKACEKAGIKSIGHVLPVTATQEEVEKMVKDLNDDPEVHGILVQLPLPDGLDDESVLRTISIEKDVDGFHPLKYWSPGAERQGTHVCAGNSGWRFIPVEKCRSRA